MTSGKTAKRLKKPALETDSYRIWDGRDIPANELEKLQGTCLEVHAGERIHEVLSLDLGQRGVVRILSKERIKDGRINCLGKLERSDGKCSVLGPDQWLTLKQYDEVVQLLRAEYGEERISVIPGGEIHANVSRAVGSGRKKVSGRQRQGAESSSAETGSGRYKSRGGDCHEG